MRAKVNVKVSAEVNTYLHELYNQIQYEFCEQYEDEIKSLQQKVEQLENIRKEAIDFVNNNTYEYFHDGNFKDKALSINKTIFIDSLLNILNKGSE